MKKLFFISLLFIQLSLFSIHSSAQCSICTKTTQQLGEKPARGLNSGILYLAFAPFAIAGYVAYRWWRSNQES
jgi:hypothetical protein